MAERENKFLVVNSKHLEELDDIMPQEGILGGCAATNRIRNAIKNFKAVYESNTEKQLNQKYVVCNQDESYAEDVWQIILNGENEK
ncbi:MAG: hypothetical protein JRC86_05475 [Deltaproteobacteria bacterium]|nr:hypothetical protein [Deltaproteobacteria bacterium]